MSNYKNITLDDGTASRVPYLDSNKKITTSSVTDTELGYLSGATSNIQTQLDAVSSKINQILIIGNGTLSLPLITGNDSHIYAVGDTQTLQIKRLKIQSNNTIRQISGIAWKNLSPTYDAHASMTINHGATDYIYSWVRKTADVTYYLVRITISDGTVTEMTFSGTAPDNDANNRLAFQTNGTLCIFDMTTTTVRRYSISGTTATYIDSITLSNAATTTAHPSIDGSDNFIYSSATNTLQKDNSSGTNVDSYSSITGTFDGLQYAIFKSNGDYYCIIRYNVSAATAYIHTVLPFLWE